MNKLIGMFLLMGAVAFGFGNVLLGHYGSAPAATVPASMPIAASATKPPVSTGPQVISLIADASGHFTPDIRINGQFLKGMVDTGATVLAIPLAEARKIGISPPTSAFTVPIRTANGEVRAARIMLSEARIGSIVVREIEAVIVPAGLDITLIGMSFFNKIGSFEMRGKTLVLRQ